VQGSGGRRLCASGDAGRLCGNRIRVFVNDEKLPHIDLEDKNSKLAPPGEVALGGGWIDTEFDDLTVTPLAEDALKGVRVEEYRMALTTQEKEKKRSEERAQYTSVKLDKLTADRTITGRKLAVHARLPTKR